MRKIEQNMRQAIREQRNWRKDNTRVHIVGDIAYIKLHGHELAMYAYPTRTLYLNLQTLNDWPTPTTRSRVRALGVPIYQRNWEQYIVRDGEPLNVRALAMRGRYLPLDVSI